MDNAKVFAMKLSRVYPLPVAKAQRKGRTRQEADAIACRLTGYDGAGLSAQPERDVDCGAFFEEAPALNPAPALIKGSVCGVRAETIEVPLMQKIRRLDKLVDEPAKGKPPEKILRG